jgi:vancomycin permeability regulator SanA
VLKKTLAYILLFLLLQGCVFLRPSNERQFIKAKRKAPFDVAIVPGCPYEGKEWSRAMKGRVVWAVYLYKTGMVKNLIFSGAAVYSPYVEGKIMGLYAEALGVPKEHIYIEDKAQHTTENVYYSYHIARKLGFTKIAIATDPFQYRMITGFANRRFKLPIAEIPFVVDSLEKVDDVYPTIDPSSAKVENFKPIMETQSKWQRFLGTAGKHIKFESERKLYN